MNSTFKLQFQNGVVFNIPKPVASIDQEMSALIHSFAKTEYCENLFSRRISTQPGLQEDGVSLKST